MKKLTTKFYWKKSRQGFRTCRRTSLRNSKKCPLTRKSLWRKFVRDRRSVLTPITLSLMMRRTKRSYSSSRIGSRAVKKRLLIGSGCLWKTTLSVFKDVRRLKQAVVARKLDGSSWALSTPQQVSLFSVHATTSSASGERLSDRAISISMSRHPGQLSCEDKANQLRYHFSQLENKNCFTGFWGFGVLGFWGFS